MDITMQGWNGAVGNKPLRMSSWESVTHWQCQTMTDKNAKEYLVLRQRSQGIVGTYNQNIDK